MKMAVTITAWNTTTTSDLVVSSSSPPYDMLPGNGTDPYHVISAEDRERIVAICIIMACTLIGNIVLILSLLCRRSKRVRRVNIFLINLAFGDLAVAMFVNSTEILFIAFGDWVLGPVMCKVIVYVQMVCLASATNLLTAMSLDRYQVIVKPMESLRERPRVLLKIAVAWALSLVFPIPQLFIFVQYDHGRKPDGTFRRICGSKGYTSPWQRKAYFTFTTIYILIIPMAIMVFCYTKIIHVVRARANMTALQFKSSQRQNQNRPNSHRGSPETPERSPSAARTTRSTAASPKMKTCASHSNATGQSSTRVTNEVWEDGRNNDLLNPPRFIGRSGQIHVKWVSNDKNNTKVSNADYARKNREQCASGPGAVERKGGKKYGSARLSVRRNLMASKRRALIMTLSVVVSFLVCLTPYFVSTLIRIYSDYELKMETVKVISEFMFMIHSTLNPVLYGLFSLRKHHLKYIVSLILCSKKSGNKKAARETKEMQLIGKRRQGKSRRRDCDKEITSSSRCFGKEIGDSPKSISTCASSSLSASSKPSRTDCSQTITKDDLLHVVTFDDDSITQINSDGIAHSASKSRDEKALYPFIASNNAAHANSHSHSVSGLTVDIIPVPKTTELVDVSDCDDTAKGIKDDWSKDRVCITRISDTDNNIMVADTPESR